MPYSSSLTDTGWEIIEPLLPQKKQTRPPKWSKRKILDGILYQLKNGCNWCDLPKDLPVIKPAILVYKGSLNSEKPPTPLVLFDRELRQSNDS